MPPAEDDRRNIETSRSRTITLFTHDNKTKTKTSPSGGTVPDSWTQKGGGEEDSEKDDGAAGSAGRGVNGDRLSKEEVASTSLAVNPLNLHLRTTPDRGRGVFTRHSIPTGTLIEESPVLLLSKTEWDDGALDKTTLGSYGFCWTHGGMAIGLGLGTSTRLFREVIDADELQLRYSTTRMPRT